VVVSKGHELLGQDGQPLRGRCDSSVVKTDVHYLSVANYYFQRKISHLISIAVYRSLPTLSPYME